jgi:hypothetical protein
MSSLNKIIANVTKTALPINTRNFYNEQQLVTIDTSFNRIGINTLNPRYSIDISGTNGTIYSYRILSSIIDTSSIKIQDGSFGFIDVSNIRAQHLNIDLSAVIRDISCTNMDVSNIRAKYLNVDLSAVIRDISCTNIQVSDVKFTKIIGTDISVISISNNILYVSEKADISNLKCSTADISNLIITKKFNVAQNATFNCSGEFFSTNNITVLGQIIADRLESKGTLTCNELQFNSIVANNPITPKFEKLTVLIDFSSNKITCISLNVIDISTVDISCSHISGKDISSNNIRITNKLDCSDAIQGIILPLIWNPQTHNINGQLFYDIGNDLIKIYNNKIFNIVARQRWLRLSLNPNIVGNIGITNNNENCIESSSNLIIPGQNYKYIPLTIDESSNITDFSTDVSAIIIHDISATYRIEATVSVQYINRYAGDFEITDYNFGIYNMGTTQDVLTETRNQILVIDTSYNFSSSHISWIGKLNSNTRCQFRIGTTNIDSLLLLRIEKFTGVLRRIE